MTARKDMKEKVDDERTDEYRPFIPLINPDCVLTALIYDRLC